MAFARGTTPTITFTLDADNVDLTQANNVYVTFRWGTGATMTKTGNELTITEKSIAVRLTQEETFAFTDHQIKIQVNWTYADGTRWSTDCVSYRVTEQLLNRVVP